MAKKIVCGGITGKTGFNMFPPQASPTYVEFVPGVALEVSDVVADYLLKMNPEKFSVVAEPVAEVVAAGVVEPKKKQSKK